MRQRGRRGALGGRAGQGSPVGREGKGRARAAPGCRAHMVLTGTVSVIAFSPDNHVTSQRSFRSSAPRKS